MQPIDPEIYLGDLGGAPLEPPKKSRAKQTLFCPADGGDMGFMASELSSFASPFFSSDDVDVDADGGQIDFYQGDDDDDIDADTVVGDDEPKKKNKAPRQHVDVDVDVDVDDSRGGRGISHDSSVSVDLGIYIIGGLFLILIMEQFIQLGIRLRQ
jgi:hypothetical protein